MGDPPPAKPQTGSFQPGATGKLQSGKYVHESSEQKSRLNLHWGAEEEVSNSTRDCSQFGTKRMLQKDHGFTEFILPPPHPNVPFPTINLKLVGCYLV